MSKLKPNFILTARAYRRAVDRMFQALTKEKPTHLMNIRRSRLQRLYLIQIKIAA